MFSAFTHVLFTATRKRQIDSERGQRRGRTQDTKASQKCSLNSIITALKKYYGGFFSCDQQLKNVPTFWQPYFSAYKAEIWRWGNVLVRLYVYECLNAWMQLSWICACYSRLLHDAFARLLWSLSTSLLQLGRRWVTHPLKIYVGTQDLLFWIYSQIYRLVWQIRTNKSQYSSS